MLYIFNLLYFNISAKQEYKKEIKKGVYPREYLPCDGCPSGLWTQFSVLKLVWVTQRPGNFYSHWGKDRIQVIGLKYEAMSTCVLQQQAWWNKLTCGWRDWVPPQKSCAQSLWRPTSSFCRSSGKSACLTQHSRSLEKGAERDRRTRFSGVWSVTGLCKVLLWHHQFTLI